LRMMYEAKHSKYFSQSAEANDKRIMHELWR
jgi:hypothetical protein